MNVRKVQDGDRKALVELLMEKYRFHTSRAVVQDRVNTVVRKGRKGGDYRCLVAEDGDGIQGFIFATREGRYGLFVADFVWSVHFVEARQPELITRLLVGLSATLDPTAVEDILVLNEVHKATGGSEGFTARTNAIEAAGAKHAGILWRH